MSTATATTRLRVRSITWLTPLVHSVVLESLDRRPLPPARPGAHVDLRLGAGLSRSYSIVGDAGAPFRYEIAVARDPNSRGGSRFVHESLRVGDQIEVSAPRNLFELEADAACSVLIAGGIGITPITGIAAALRRRNIDAALHYAVKSRGDAAFLDELSALLGDRLIVHASDEGARLDLEATFRALPDDAIAIMCGPMRMLEAARHAWNDLGRAPADLRYETFGSSGLKPTAEFRVRLKDTGAELVVPQNSSMLDTLNSAGFEVISDCQRGECGVCAIDVVAVDGEIDHRDVFFSDQQKRDNRKICPCVSRAIGVVTIDTLYRPEAAHR
jgi:vanillate O-demethylase ferredoxin subunit